MWNKSSFQYVKYGTGSSPGCISVFEKSIERRSKRGGVPVLNRPSSKSEFLKRRRKAHCGNIAGTSAGLLV